MARARAPFGIWPVDKKGRARWVQLKPDEDGDCVGWSVEVERADSVKRALAPRLRATFEMGQESEDCEEVRARFDELRDEVMRTNPETSSIADVLEALRVAHEILEEVGSVDDLDAPIFDYKVQAL